MADAIVSAVIGEAVSRVISLLTGHFGVKMAMGTNYPQTRGYQTRRARIRTSS